MKLVVALALILVLPARALAGDLVVDVRTSQGKPVANAVVTVAAPHTGPIRFPWPCRMAQHNMQFDPFVLIVPVGADVAFPNLDTVRHHVYSFSAAKTFELKLFGHDETRVVHFDKAGVVDLGCNIHDNMIAFIDVVDTPYAAQTNAAGEAVVRGVPAGTRGVRVWHPYLRAPGNSISVNVAVRAEGQVSQAVVADLRAPPDMHRMY
jgi:plastocyanin